MQLLLLSLPLLKAWQSPLPLAICVNKPGDPLEQRAASPKKRLFKKRSGRSTGCLFDIKLIVDREQGKDRVLGAAKAQASHTTASQRLGKGLEP